ncbi:MAG: hydroxymethylbilane synthase [Gammaproteobacteria bacterium]
MRLRIATRESELALWQARHVAERLERLPEVEAVELVPMTTKGDRILDRTLSKIGGKGLFIKELERAMESGDADIAVHSMKDVPGEMPPGFALPAVLEREDPRDAMVGSTLEALPAGAVVGTSSLRRQSQVLVRRPDVSVKPLRGNVQTRLAKLDAGDYTAIMLAAAGLKRLGLTGRIAECVDPEVILPANGQGIVGIECHEGREDLIRVVGRLEDEEARRVVAAERRVGVALGADCHSPIAVYATTSDARITIRARVIATDGSRMLEDRIEGPAADGEELGATLAERLLTAGAAEILAAADAAAR